MRYMMLMIPKVYQGGEGAKVGADFTPDAEAVERMMRYNQDLADTGALLAADGPHPMVTGARVKIRKQMETVR